MKKLLLYPAVEEFRLKSICEAAGDMLVVNTEDGELALVEIVDATAFFGKMTPELLAAAQNGSNGSNHPLRASNIICFLN